VGQALDGAGAVLLAIPGPAVADLVTEHGAALADKVVIDAVNRIGQPQVHSRSAITGSAPGAHYARAFNTLGWENFATPAPGSALFFAADPAARAVTEELITAVGLEPAYVGDGDAARTVDGVVPLWFALVQQQGGNRKLAFQILR
jgi:8-hydroxy-5-deazaflavin:NADPH oxidoreductase